MLREIAESVRRGIRRVGSFIRWIDDPYTGGKIRRPLSQKIAPTGLSLLIIPFHKALKVTKDIALAEIFHKLAHLVDGLIGVLRDLRRPGYNYLGFFIRCIGSFLRGLGSALLRIGKSLGRTISSRIR